MLFLPEVKIPMAATTVSAKRCFSCRKDVTTDKRMKDSSGRYWCVSCGTEQQKKKAAAALAKREKQKAGGASVGKSRLVKMIGFLGLLAAAAAIRFAMGS